MAGIWVIKWSIHTPPTQFPCLRTELEGYPHRFDDHLLCFLQNLIHRWIVLIGNYYPASCLIFNFGESSFYSLTSWTFFEIVPVRRICHDNFLTIKVYALLGPCSLPIKSSGCFNYKSSLFCSHQGWSCLVYSKYGTIRKLIEQDLIEILLILNNLVNTILLISKNKAMMFCYTWIIIFRPSLRVHYCTALVFHL